MSRTKYASSTLPYGPVASLPPTDASAWVPSNQKQLTFCLGNRASVEEISGQRELGRQKWRFRVCRLGGETGVHATPAAAMRAAEFALGIGEMPVRLPDVAAGKKGGAA